MLMAAENRGTQKVHSVMMVWETQKNQHVTESGISNPRIWPKIFFSVSWPGGTDFCRFSRFRRSGARPASSGEIWGRPASSRKDFDRFSMDFLQPRQQKPWIFLGRGWKSIDFIDFHWFSLIFIDFSRFGLPRKGTPKIWHNWISFGFSSKSNF